MDTTCRERPTCLKTNAVLVAEEVFGDLLPGRVDAKAALARHDRRLWTDGACAGACGVPRCRAPFYDEAGLTQHRIGADATARGLTLGGRACAPGAATPTDQESRS